MKILFFHRWVGVRYGGTETHIKEISTRLAKLGHAVHILTREGKFAEDIRSSKLPIKVWTIRKNWMESDSSFSDIHLRFSLFDVIHATFFAVKAFLWLLILKLKGDKYDVVSVHFFTEAFLLRMFRWLFRLPYIFFLEGYTEHEAWEAKYADLQLSNSQTVAKKCLLKYGYKPLVGLVGTDTRLFTPNGEKISLSLNKKIIFTLSRLTPQKNIHIFVEAAKIVCKKDPKFLFLIGGEGSEKPRLKELIKKYNLEDNVFLIGGVSNEELPVYYRSVEMFVTTEFPPDEMLITAIEAMSSGIPVIATSPTGKFEIINQSGLIVPYNNPDKLAKAILTLGYDYKLRNELIKKGLDRSKMYDWNRLVKIYENACNYVITKNINKTT